MTNKLHPLASKITKSQLVEIVYPVVVIPRVLLLLSDTQSEMVYQHAMKVITMCVYHMYMYIERCNFKERDQNKVHKYLVLQYTMYCIQYTLCMLKNM